MRSPQPTLKTKRLILCPFALADAEATQRLAGDRAIADTTVNIPHPYANGMAEAWIGTHRKGYERGEAVYFAVLRREDKALIGAISLEQVDSRHGHAELGYWIGRPYWNHGYCTEAAAAMLQYGFSELNLYRIFATHFVRNQASGRVMQKLGMVKEGRLRGHVKKWEGHEDLVLYGILKHDYLKNARADMRQDPLKTTLTAAKATPGEYDG